MYAADRSGRSAHDRNGRKLAFAAAVNAAWHMNTLLVHCPEAHSCSCHTRQSNVYDRMRHKDKHVMSTKMPSTMNQHYTGSIKCKTIHITQRSKQLAACARNAVIIRHANNTRQDIPQATQKSSLNQQHISQVPPWEQQPHVVLITLACHTSTTTTLRAAHDCRHPPLTSSRTIIGRQHHDRGTRMGTMPQTRTCSPRCFSWTQAHARVRAALVPCTRWGAAYRMPAVPQTPWAARHDQLR
jgi:hypothetical protein